MKQSLPFQLKITAQRYADNTLTTGQKILEEEAGSEEEMLQLDSFKGARCTGSIQMHPLGPVSGSGRAQAVLLSALHYSEPEEGRMLLREAQMHAWELNYHVAFFMEEDPLLMECGFMKLEGTPVSLPGLNGTLFYYELSWKGMKALTL